MHAVELCQGEVAGLRFGFFLAAGEAFTIVIILNIVAVVSALFLVALVPFLLGFGFGLFAA